MGIQINGTNDVISAADGSLTVLGTELKDLSQLNVTGVATAASLVVSGNASIGGTITYMDVSNVDSVGIITAQQGLQVGANGINVTGISTLGGKVLINTSTQPSGQVDLLVNRSSGPGSIQLAYNGSSGGAIVPGSSGGLEFFTYTGSIGSETYAERARFDSSGNFGVGTNSINAKLHVSNGGAEGIEFEPNSGTSNISLTQYYNRSGTTWVANRQNAADHRFEIQGSEKLRIDSSGRLLINTTSSIASGYQFQVKGSTSANQALIHGSSSVSGGSDVGQIDWYDNSGNRYGLIAVTAESGTSGSPGRITFGTTADTASSPTERLRIDSTGRVTTKASTNGEIDTLSDGATITPNFNNSDLFTVTLGGNRTLANPSNITAGQSGSIFIVQDGTGSRTLSFGSYWDFVGGTAPTLTTTASAVDRIDYVVRTSTSIHAVFTANYS